MRTSAERENRASRTGRFPDADITCGDRGEKRREYRRLPLLANDVPIDRTAGKRAELADGPADGPWTAGKIGRRAWLRPRRFLRRGAGDGAR